MLQIDLLIYFLVESVSFEMKLRDKISFESQHSLNFMFGSDKIMEVLLASLINVATNNCLRQSFCVQLKDFIPALCTVLSSSLIYRFAF